MKATELFSSSQLLNQLSKKQALGFIVEFIPRQKLVELGDYSTDPRLKKIIRTTIKNLNATSENIDSETLLIIDSTGAEFYRELATLNQITCFDIGVVINRSFHLWDYSLPKFKGFYHFPISETFEEVHWSLDEIFLFLKQLECPGPQGPPWYLIFDPAWKYLTPPLSQSESFFNTFLDVKVFREAYSHTIKSADFRHGLLQMNKHKKYSLELLSFFYFELPKQFKKSKKAIKKIPGNILNILKRVEPLWKVFERYWCKYIYWPIEYQIRNRQSKFSNEEYEAIKTLEVQKRTEEKRLAIERRLRKR